MSKTDMSRTCGFKYHEYWDKANNKRTMTQEEFKKWYNDNCAQCIYMGEICMYGEE